MKERELLFRPTREAAGWYGGMPEMVQELYLPVGTTSPGERIHAWYWPAGTRPLRTARPSTWASAAK